MIHRDLKLENLLLTQKDAKEIKVKEIGEWEVNDFFRQSILALLGWRATSMWMGRTLVV